MLGRLLWPSLGRGDTRRLGRRGEREAARYLQRKRYRVLGKNVRVHAGEADLVCLAPDRRTIVVVEVKSRLRVPDQPAASAAIAPEASVGEKKKQTLIRITQALARLNNWTGRPLRIDAVAVEFQTGRRRPAIRHMENAVTL